jgi:hypothetical protein
MRIKTSGLVKVGLVFFIGFAVYLGHKNFFDKIPEKIKDSIPKAEEVEEQQFNTESQESLNFKFSSKSNDSFFGNLVAGTFNKILDNPHGRVIMKDVIQNIMRQSQEIAGRDLFLSRYIVQDISEGIGKKAMCGDTVEISYTLANSKSDNQPEQELTTTMVIGGGRLGINFENGIIGMQEGAERQIVYPGKDSVANQLLEPKQPNAASGSVKLLSIKNKQAVGGKLGRAFFDKIEGGYTSRTRLICGDSVQGGYSFTDINGKVLHDSHVLFKVGESKVPAELSNAIMGLPADKVNVSFITSLSGIAGSFSKYENFIPKNLSTKKTTDPIILDFKLYIANKP